MLNWMNFIPFPITNYGNYTIVEHINVLCAVFAFLPLLVRYYRRRNVFLSFCNLILVWYHTQQLGSQLKWATWYIISSLKNSFQIFILISCIVSVQRRKTVLFVVNKHNFYSLIFTVSNFKVEKYRLAGQDITCWHTCQQQNSRNNKYGHIQ